MNKQYASFGDFLTDKREERNITMRELARRLGVSAPFVSDVEKNRCAPLTTERLESVADILQLSPEERTQMYDIAGSQRDSIAPDLPVYIKGKDYVSYAMRTARDLDADESDWLAFVEELKRRKGNIIKPQ